MPKKEKVNVGDVLVDAEEPTPSSSVVALVTADVEEDREISSEMTTEADTSPTLGRLRTRKCVRHPVIH